MRGVPGDALRGVPREASVIVWFRGDLRVSDHGALRAAADAGGPVVPLFILDDTDPWAPGAASRWWLHHSLTALAAALERLGAPLVLRRGEPARVLAELAEAAGAGAVYWNRDHVPYAAVRDDAVAAALASRGVAVRTFGGNLLFEPGTVRTRNGAPFRVFGPFWRACLAAVPPPVPLPPPERLRPLPGGETLVDGAVVAPPGGGDDGLRETWTPGEAGAQARLLDFLDGALGDYAGWRDRPDREGSSRLSPHIRWGEISPRQIWHTAYGHAARAARPGLEAQVGAFMREIGWREFAGHLLHHFPSMPAEPLDRRFASFPWASDPGALAAWQQGRTGYPIVDAGLRQLRRTGWMHNRVRMIAGSFLVKDLMLPWQEGAAWFWDHLVDADLASNAMNWQWVAGCGADAAPFFRIFNPVLQGEKFDPEGHYVRRFVPELERLPVPWVHKPWQAPPAVLAAAGIILGETYPRPMVDHAYARQRALAALTRSAPGGRTLD